MMRLSLNAGFTLIEVVVALLIFAVGATALAQTVVLTQHLRASSARWQRGLELAEQRLESLRAGERSEEAGSFGAFTRSWTSGPYVVPGLDRLDVTVTWDDHGAQRLVLTTLQRHTP